MKKLNQTGNTLVLALVLVGLVTLGVLGWFAYQNSPNNQKQTVDESSTMDASNKSLNDIMQGAPVQDPSVMDAAEVLAGLADLTFDYNASLADVTNRQAVRGTIFSGDASGEAQAVFIDGEYKLYASFVNLPDPAGDDFYEGWIVDKSTSSVISTGELQKLEGQYINTYMSTRDLTDHTFYVLTIEPNDGNPAPAEHVVEGEFVKP